MIRWFGALSFPIQLIVGGVCVAVISTLDYVTGVELSFSIFYFIPIVFVSWFVGFRSGVVFAFLSAAAWAYAEFSGGREYSSLYIFAFNTFVRLGIFLIIAKLISMLKADHERIMHNEHLADKSYTVVKTSQRLISLIAHNITRHNSALWLWMVEERHKGRRFPEIIETTCLKIGENLAALTEICFSYQATKKTEVDLETLLAELEEKLTEVNSMRVLKRTEGARTHIRRRKERSETHTINV